MEAIAADESWKMGDKRVVLTERGPTKVPYGWRLMATYHRSGSTTRYQYVVP